MLRSKFIPAAMVAVFAVTGAGAAFADGGSHRERGRDRAKNAQAEITAVLNAKTSLVQAIAAAEKQTGGKAVETGVAHRNGVAAYLIETADGTTVKKVLVDLDSGQVSEAPQGGRHR
jgi:uncharacterized membrane protein YkoI